MKISPRQLFIYAAMIFVVVGLAIVVVLVETQAKTLIIGFFAWIAIGSFLLTRIRCPNCGTSVAYQGKVGKFSIYAGFVRHYCQSCGHDLTAAENTGLRK